ncbi:MAG: class I SAM-dependent methyltransferase [Candidatus Aenigmatarchaeota archaeon]
MRRIRNFRHLNLGQLIDFSSTVFFGLLKSLQIRYEILKLLQILDSVKPKYIVEIGTAYGGSLFLFCRVSSPDAIVVSVDLPGGRFGGGYSGLRTLIYKSFALRNQQLYLLRANSHHEGTLERVKSLLGGNKVDFLFIDGDHTYEGVKKDFAMYKSLVRKGGIIAFHDIAVHLPESGCEVSRFWNEIKSKYMYEEIIESRNQRGFGIGVIFK